MDKPAEKKTRTPPRKGAKRGGRGRTKAEQREQTVAEILDAAEYLFSKWGFFGVTLKDVAQHVGVHTSLIHYYFDDKQHLFEEVIARRRPIINQVRYDAMEKYQHENEGQHTVEGYLRAFLDSNLDLYDRGEEWRNFGAIGAIVNNSPVWGARLMDENFDNVARRLISLIRTAIPGCSDADLYWCYHFLSGALTLTQARTGRIDRLSNGACDSNDFGTAKELMATFMAGGFEAVCKRRMAASDADEPGEQPAGQ